MIYTIYDPTTGKIQNTITCSNEIDLALNLEGKTYIEGNYDGKHYYIVDGQAQPKDPDPSNNLIKYQFSDDSKQWIIDQTETERLARKYRSILLGLVDRINPVWWSEMSAEQQSQVVAFRQALLDVPSQAGFPTNITWPEKPSFL